MTTYGGARLGMSHICRVELRLCDYSVCEGAAKRPESGTILLWWPVRKLQATHPFPYNCGGERDVRYSLQRSRVRFRKAESNEAH